MNTRLDDLSKKYDLQPKLHTTLYHDLFPLPFSGKYITIYNEGIIPSHTYKYFNDVINDIKPHLGEIKIIQIINSSADKQLKNCLFASNFSYTQLNFIINNSLLHIATDVFTSDIAKVMKVPCLNLHQKLTQKLTINPISNLYHEISNVSINDIPSEQISNKIFKLLNIAQSVPYKTLHIGTEYPEHVIDFIPNFKPSNLPQINKLNIRYDKGGDLSIALTVSSQIKHIFWTNKPLSHNALQQIKPMNNGIVFVIDDNSPDDIDSIALDMGFKVSFCTYKLTDYIKINFIDKPITVIDCSKLPFVSDNQEFISSRIILSNGFAYNSLFHLEKKRRDAIIDAECANSNSFFEGKEYYKIVGEADGTRE